MVIRRLRGRLRFVVAPILDVFVSVSTVHDRPKMASRSPKMAQEGPKMAQDRSASSPNPTGGPDAPFPWTPTHRGDRGRKPWAGGKDGGDGVAKP